MPKSLSLLGYALDELTISIVLHLEVLCSTCMQLPDAGVITGANTTINTTLSTYYGTPSPSIEARQNYGPAEVRACRSAVPTMIT